MTRNQLIEELTKMGARFSKVVFKKESPYMKARYKKEYITWEAWVYPACGGLGVVITAEEYENKEYFTSYVDNLLK